jgi:2-aminoadipate transaminase
VEALVDLLDVLAARTDRMRTSEIRDLLKMISKDVISFAGGLPDPRTFPTSEELKEIFEFINSVRDKAFQYGVTEGLPELKEELSRYLLRIGIKAGPDEIIITSGSQQGVDMLGRIFINQRDIVVVEIPTYLAAIQAFNMYKPNYLGIPMDEDGMIIEQLEYELNNLLIKDKKPKFLYTIPTCQNPTGISMSLERRKRLLELASEYDFFIVEDDPYGHIVFDANELKRLKAMDKEGRVIYASTFSKVFSPGLRIGFVVADMEVTKYLVLSKQALDLCSPNLTQFITYYALKNGLIDRNIPKIRKIYKSKRDAMLNAMEEYMPNGVKWTKPVGGMFIFTWLPEYINTKMLLYKVLNEYKVAYVPGRSFHVDGSGWNTMRLSYSYPPEDMIIEGIRRLSEAVTWAIKKFQKYNIKQID